MQVSHEERCLYYSGALMAGQFTRILKRTPHSHSHWKRPECPSSHARIFHVILDFTDLRRDSFGGSRPALLPHDDLGLF